MTEEKTYCIAILIAGLLRIGERRRPGANIIPVDRTPSLSAPTDATIVGVHHTPYGRFLSDCRPATSHRRKQQQSP